VVKWKLDKRNGCGFFLCPNGCLHYFTLDMMPSWYWSIYSLKPHPRPQWGKEEQICVTWGWFTINAFCDMTKLREDFVILIENLPQFHDLPPIVIWLSYPSISASPLSLSGSTIYFFLNCILWP
jgi:hypothetical protein